MPAVWYHGVVGAIFDGFLCNLAAIMCSVYTPFWLQGSVPLILVHSSVGSLAANGEHSVKVARSCFATR